MSKSNDYAISIDNVTKVYQLHGSQSAQLMHVMGLDRFFSRRRQPVKEYVALTDVTLKVEKGQRVGIIGANGAGKTTLLKLLCGNIVPTSGDISISGEIQALMGMGAGFHPEYTGRENAEASLQYNGLSPEYYEPALQGIIEFSELGVFLDQPFKTYSLGMQARLMFATATAVNPEILIVDEVLGAGDAYFVAKSKIRVDQLVSSGCTMLLVSHSMAQILEICEHVLWMENGTVRMFGNAFEVVKAYEEFVYGSTKVLQESSSPIVADEVEPVKDDEQVEKPDVPECTPIFEEIDPDNGMGMAPQVDTRVAGPRPKEDVLFQEPYFVPHESAISFPDVEIPYGFNFINRSGISRWAESAKGIKICSFTMMTENGITNKLLTFKPVKFIFEIKSEIEEDFSLRYSLNVSNALGQTVLAIRSPNDQFYIKSNDTRLIEVLFNPMQLGPGEYIVGLAVLSYGALEVINSSDRYDLLSRSFDFTIENPESMNLLQNQFFHSAEWLFLER
jgi:lipopolysaccharide transport system ATP-binding protein